MKKELILFLIILICYSCNSRQKGFDGSNANEFKVDSISGSKQTNSKYLRESIGFDYSSVELKDIAGRSPYNFSMLFDNKSKTLTTCCVGNISSLFGPLIIDSMLDRYPFLEHKMEVIKQFDESFKVNIYKYKRSIIKTYYYTYIKSEVIGYANILDDSIVVMNAIKIGNAKRDFLDLFFDKRDIDFLVKYDTIDIAEDELGEADYNFIFNDNKLKQILIITASDWVNTESKFDR